MKILNYFYFKIIFFTTFCLFCCLSQYSIAAPTLANKLSGKILLQVEQNGEAWYISPDNKQRYYMGRPADAFALMRNLGLGVSEVNYNSYRDNEYIAPARLAGKIILRVEANGEAYYINPIDLKLHYLGRPADAFSVMRNLGLGITDENLNSIAVMDGYDNNVDNSNNKNNFCHSNNYTMAFILLENDANPANDEYIARLTEIKDMFDDHFHWATRGLATMDTSYPVVVLNMDYPMEIELVQEFFKHYEDNFDFLTIYNTYDANEMSYHGDIQNNIEGIGSPIFDNTEAHHKEKFVKRGKLLGVNWMQEIEKVTVEYAFWEKNSYTQEELKFADVGAMNGILHETTHQWGADVNFIDSDGTENWALRLAENNFHWSVIFNNGRAILGGGDWIDNGDGTFSIKPRDNTSQSMIRSLSNLDLYLMGLFSKEQVGPLEIIITDIDSHGITQGQIIPGYKKTITIDQIIAAEGERKCVDLTADN